ncbi:MAG: glycosyltransferase family 2 protein [Bacteroidales bacterium]|nr:glycosyltransferase family 2 protein [Bacteroidales bacterium]
MEIILYLFILIITSYVGFSTLYIFFFAFASIFRTEHKHFGKSKKFKCLVLIPAYKEDFVIREVAKKASELNYPKELLDIVVIADSLKQETIEALKNLPINVHEVKFEKSTKAKALNSALDYYKGPYDIAYVIDADNIMEPDFIQKVNYPFEKGFVAVQGHRVAKNTNTNVAILDAISEEINNSIFRQGHRALGVSSAFIGSGLAVQYDLFKEMMKKVSHVGEDKELEIFLLKDHHTIEYVPNALVYDEKVQQYSNMVNQRRRWLFAQFDFFGQYISEAFYQLFAKGNINFFDKVIQQALIPRSLLIGTIGLYFIILGFIFVLSNQLPAVMLIRQWLTIALLLFLTMLLAVPKKHYNLKTLNALAQLPLGIIVMFISLIKSAFNGNTFFHTSHGVSGNEKQK